jgi:predicted component of viral defense system (DUF524 family)
LANLKLIRIPLYFDKDEEFVLFAEQDNRDSLRILEENEAMEFGESQYQILEGCSYEYSFKKQKYYLKESEIISVSKRDKSSGRIVPNIYVGRLPIEIWNMHTKELEGKIELEVNSVKSSYRKDYRSMLEFITEKCTDLLLQSGSPVKQIFNPDYLKNSKTLYQRFAFIQSVINTEEFGEAVQRIISSPVTCWKEQPEQIDTRKIKRISGKELKQIGSGSNRISIPSTHSLSKIGLKDLPGKIESRRKADTVDTPENRFVKHALEVFLQLCYDIESKTKDNSLLKNEANAVIKMLESFLSHSIFREVSRPTTLRLNSPVLQRKEGYREILRTWLMFDLAALLVWKGGEDVYEAGKRDVATLYEYWLFFTLLELFGELFNLKPKDVSDLIIPSEDGLSLTLKQGKETAIEGVFDPGSRKLNVKFCFNRSFSGGMNYPKGGSWTKTMRPDYTLTIWPDGISENEAELQELIVHVHFDAKYKIDNLTEIINQTEDDENIVNGSIRGKYKNVDLLKMHAYKDAIRRTAGAYILYPGDQTFKEEGFHEIIPGLGAFPIKPSKSKNGTEKLKEFIKEVIAHFLNRASQSEKMSYRTFDIHKTKPDNFIFEPIPEAIGENRGFIPDEIFVLVGYCRNKTRHVWYLENGLYNFRMDDDAGSLELNEEVSKAKFLLLRQEGETASEVFRIKSKGPKVYSKQKLLEMNYPEPNQEYYLIIEIEKLKESFFGPKEFSFKKLFGYQELSKRIRNLRKLAGAPFTATLTELMQAKV